MSFWDWWDKHPVQGWLFLLLAFGIGYDLLSQAKAACESRKKAP